MPLILTLVYIVTLAFWVILTIKTGHSVHPAGLYLQLVLFLIPFLAAIAGFKNAKAWGKSAVGKAVNFLSLGTLTWSLGMLAWNYYIFLADVEVPYPSLADVFFILSWPLWTLGIINLSKATGVKFALRQVKGKILIVIVPILAVIASYYMLVVVARGGVIELDGSSGWKLFFDLFYPIGTAVILTLALTFFSLSRDYLGGIYKKPITILILGFLANYLSDFTFSLTTTSGTYFNGHFVDILFLTAMYFIGLSISLMSPKVEKFSTIEGGISDRVMMSLDKITSSIIKQQELIIGPLAWAEAGKVLGIKIIDQTHGQVILEDNDPKSAIDKLISQYERLFGRASREVCREAATPFLANLSPAEIPSSLK